MDIRDSKYRSPTWGLRKSEIVAINQYACTLSRGAWDLVRAELLKHVQAIKAARGIACISAEELRPIRAEFSVQLIESSEKSVGAVKPAVPDDKPL